MEEIDEWCGGGGSAGESDTNKNVAFSIAGHLTGKLEGSDQEMKWNIVHIKCMVKWLSA